jgi:hypothetical protein
MKCDRVNAKRFAAIKAAINGPQYSVIDADGKSHGEYPSLDQARGCAAFDRIQDYSIWCGNSFVEAA